MVATTDFDMVVHEHSPYVIAISRDTIMVARVSAIMVTVATYLCCWCCPRHDAEGVRETHYDQMLLFLSSHRPAQCRPINGQQSISTAPREEKKSINTGTQIGYNSSSLKAL
jgi:hypothetical protein